MQCKNRSYGPRNLSNLGKAPLRPIPGRPSFRAIEESGHFLWIVSRLRFKSASCIACFDCRKRNLDSTCFLTLFAHKSAHSTSSELSLISIANFRAQKWVWSGRKGVNRPGFVGDFILWKRGWNHGQTQQDRSKVFG
jgi:hypothetical protein